MTDRGWQGWSESAGALVDAHDAVLLDLDGVVYVGEHAVDGAVAAIDEVRRRGVGVAFVTNNAARTPDDVAEHLRRLGVDAAPADVVTSAQAAASLLREQLEAGAAVLSIGARGLAEALVEVGLRPVGSMDDEPLAVVQGFSPDLSWPMLLEACVAIRAGLPWVATNLDATLPTARGPAPGNGAFVEVVRRTTGVDPQVAGKPFRPLMDASVQRLRAERGLVVGDRLDTDLEGARRAGLPGLLVLTGVTDAGTLLGARPEERPDFLAADLGGLLEPHPGVRAESGGWVADDGTTLRAVLDENGDLHLSGEPAAPGESGRRVALAAVRLACAALWSSQPSADRVQQARRALRPWTVVQGWDG
ncbi:HAD-IIA family hydrolase [Angustibacter luteus]|uniref:HAD-IIA family hydrolase n=1 Tax=Angustibacter luteus TaxID=658456 RepID=A0ABW1J9T9_9ACTN